MENKIINTLKKLDLTQYEAQVYYTLTKKITATAQEISTESNVPRTKIYNILKRLKEKGYLETDNNRPIHYTVIPPRDIYRKEKEKLIKELNETEELLTESYENQISQVLSPVWLIHNEEKILEKEIEIILKAKETINMRIGYLLPKEEIELEKAFKKIGKEIKIKILLSKNLKLDKKIEKLENVKIKKTNLPLAKIIMRDKKEILHIFSKFDENQEIIPNTSIGILNQYQDIANNYDNRFLKQFKKIGKEKQ